MRVRQLARLGSGVLAAATVGLALAMSPAQAATTYTPTGGPGINFVGNGVSLKDIEAEQSFTCPTFNLGGSVTSPGTRRAYGATVGAVAIQASKCTNLFYGPTAVSHIGTWGLTITGDSTGAAWPSRLVNVKLRFSAANCTFTVSGTVSGRFNDSTGTFTPNGGASGLTIDSGSGAPTGAMCLTLDLQSEDTIAVGGSWTNKPPTGSAALDISNP